MDAKKVAIAIGNSHITAIQAAACRREGLINLIAHPLMAPSYTPHWVDDDGSLRLNPKYQSDVRSSFKTHRPEVAVCLAASNFAFYVGSVNYPNPLDFIVPGHESLELLDSATIVPFDVMIQSFMHQSAMWREVFKLAKSCTSAPLVAVSAPPPLADLAGPLSKISGPGRERLESMGIAPSWLRYKMWLLQVYGERQMAAEYGAAYLMPPNEALDEDGFLKPQYSSDTLHGTPEYGAMVLQQIAEFIVSSAERKGLKEHPYKTLPAHCFWRQSVAQPPYDEVDPVVRAKFTVKPTDRIATAGSCFAQHIARHLSANGFHYLVTESPHWLTKGIDAEKFGYGIFTARYGNVYTSRQLLQLLQRAYGLFQPEDDAWLRPDGRIIDPFRPQIQPDGFASLQEYSADRRQHFDAIRRATETMDVMVFTLGLTETWASRLDGAAYPLCPGVAGGRFDADRHVFLNLTVDEVVADMRAAIDLIRARNSGVRVILTVSPVPLIATAEDRSVLASTAYSKAVLRVAAERISSEYDHVAYFPSYEIITGQHAKGRYFSDDLRTVTTAGVEHVMRLFMQHYAVGVSGQRPAALEDEASEVGLEQVRAMQDVATVMCDEEALQQA